MTNGKQNAKVQLDCFECGQMCGECNKCTSRTCKSCRGEYCVKQ